MATATEAGLRHRGFLRTAPRRVLAKGLDRLHGWFCARQHRLELANLSDRTLKDIGLTRADVEIEAAQPFWRPIDLDHLERVRRRRWPNPSRTVR